ncbi:MAG TPA: cytochrome c maturation protein CcmE [Acidobacteriota bacterium]|jgi:cytochrome c-type biogenesis protein CcmE
MEHRGLKLTVGTLAILAALGYLLYAGLKETTRYYVTVTELVQAPPPYAGTAGVRVAGKIVDGSIARRDLELSFELTDGQHSIPVHYRGLVPDTFKYGADVVAEGLYRNHEGLDADLILAKCPSKFTPKKENQAAT